MKHLRTVKAPTQHAIHFNLRTRVEPVPPPSVSLYIRRLAMQSDVEHSHFVSAGVCLILSHLHALDRPDQDTPGLQLQEGDRCS